MFVFSKYRFWSSALKTFSSKTNEIFKNKMEMDVWNCFFFLEIRWLNFPAWRHLPAGPGTTALEFTISIGEEEAYLRVSLSKLKLRERKGFLFLLVGLAFISCLRSYARCSCHFHVTSVLGRHFLDLTAADVLSFVTVRACSPYPMCRHLFHPADFDQVAENWALYF